MLRNTCRWSAPDFRLMSAYHVTDDTHMLMSKPDGRKIQKTDPVHTIIIILQMSPSKINVDNPALRSHCLFYLHSYLKSTFAFIIKQTKYYIFHDPNIKSGINNLFFFPHS